MDKHMKKFRDFCEGKQIEWVEDEGDDGLIFTFTDNTKLYLFSCTSDNGYREPIDFFLEDDDKKEV